MRPIVALVIAVVMPLNAGSTDQKPLEIKDVVLEGTQIVVTAVSQSLTGPAQASAPPRPTNPQPFVSPNRAPAQNPFQAQGNPNRAVSGNRNAGNASAQPAIIQTPFGPLVNPRANQNQQQQPGNPMAMPGQAGFPFRTSGASATGIPTSPGGTILPSIPGAQPGSQPNVFGNTSPTILDLNKKTPNPPQPKP
jgi:hypothetical protein